ncbi:MAG: nucleoside-diphosphate kinase [Candidatus Woesearchaeota archaeon]
MEQTFIIIKPEWVHLAQEILNELDNHGIRIKTSKIDSIPINIVENHYSAHKEKVIYPWLLNEFVNKPVVIAIYEGENVVERFKELIGPTDPSQASKHTIRARYSNDSKEKAEAEKRTVKTVIHRSGSIEEAQQEIQIWEHLFN